MPGCWPWLRDHLSCPSRAVPHLSSSSTSDRGRSGVVRCKSDAGIYLPSRVKKDGDQQRYLSQLSRACFHWDQTPADMSRAIPAKLLQPAQDSVMIQPNRKAMFVDSAFFSASMHPTWEQQVHLARRISVSLSDVNNRQSRGQCMYEQRKRRSDKWVHQENKSLPNITRSGGQELGENGEQCNHQPSQTKPLTKLLTNPHGNVYDMKALAQDEWISNDKGVMSPEVCSGLLKDLSSPLCKGAQIFAKRKKRSEKWVVDEMNREVRREDNCPPVRASSYDVTCKPLVSTGPHMPQQQTAPNPPQQPPSAPHTDGKRLGRSATFNTNWCKSSSSRHPVVRASIMQSRPQYHCNDTVTGGTSERTTTDVQQPHSSRPGLNYDTTTKCHHQNSAVLKRQSWCNYNTAASGWNAHRDVYQPVTFM